MARYESLQSETYHDVDIIFRKRVRIGRDGNVFAFADKVREDNSVYREQIGMGRTKEEAFNAAKKTIERDESGDFMERKFSKTRAPISESDYKHEGWRD